jgi:hypothetical protein
MSKINLTTVLWYQAGKDRRPIMPTLALEGVESRFPSVKFPTSGITFLYGHRNPGEAYLLREAPKHDLTPAVVQVSVDIGNWLRNKAGFAPDDPERGIEHTGFLALNRAKKEVTDAVESVWARHLPPDSEDHNRNGTRFAHFMDEVILMEKFKHLSVIAYTVSTKEAGEIQVATLFNLRAIDGITCGQLLADIDITCDAIKH